MAAQQPLRGLGNLGQTSYMNAVLQALFSCEQFYEHIIPSANDIRHPLHQRIANLFLGLNRRQDMEQLLRIFRNRFLNTADNQIRFPENTENDSQVFYSTLLHNLQSEDNDLDDAVENVNLLAATTTEEAWDLLRNAIRNHALIDIFGGLYHYVRQCSVVFAHIQNVWHPFWTASLEIPPEDPNVPILDVQHYLDFSEIIETIDVENCQQCGNQVTRTQTHAKMPQIFVIHMNLFRVENRVQHKIRAKIVINDNIVLGENYYRLFALISHEGNSTTDGHYKTTRRRDRLSQQWIEFDDLFVNENLAETQLINNLSLAYILFYTKLEQAVDTSNGHFETFQRSYFNAMTALSAINLDFDINIDLPLTSTGEQQIDVNVRLQDIPPIHPIELQVQQQQREDNRQSTSGRQKRSADSESGPKRKRGRPPKPKPSPPHEPEHRQSESQKRSAESDLESEKLGTPSKYRDNACVIRFKDDKQEYVFRLNIAEQREYCVSYDIQQSNWYLFIQNIMLYDIKLIEFNKLVTVYGYYLVWGNENILIATQTRATFLTVLRDLEIHSVLPFIHRNEVMCGLLVEEEKRNPTTGQRLWWCLGAEPEFSGISEFSVWNPNSFIPYVQRLGFGLFLFKGARLVMEDQRIIENNSVMNNTLFLNATFIVVCGELKVSFGNIRTPVFNFAKLQNNNLIALTFNHLVIKHPILFLHPLRDDNLAALWYMNLDFRSHIKELTLNRTAFLQLPLKTDLNRISYLDWNEGLEFVKYEQRQRDWTTNVEYGEQAIAYGLQLPQLYANTQPPQQTPIQLGRVANN